MDYKDNEELGTYTKAVLEGDAADGERVEELRDRLAAGLRVGGGTGGGVLGGSEVGDALSRVVDEIGGDSHDVVKKNIIKGNT